MKVKICGITKKEDALLAEEAGADLIGFVFAPSKRRISPVNAAAIANQLPDHIKKVGVFVNEAAENMIHIAKLVGLDYIQLHGDESAQLARSLPYPIIKAFSIDKATPETIRKFPCDYLLIDSPGEKYQGGSGRTFDWSKLDKLGIEKSRFILAGGLSADNVQEAIKVTGAIGVDVSSGVETDGVKNHDKIIHFIENAKANRKVEVN